MEDNEGNEGKIEEEGENVAEENAAGGEVGALDEEEEEEEEDGLGSKRSGTWAESPLKRTWFRSPQL